MQPWTMSANLQESLLREVCTHSIILVLSCCCCCLIIFLSRGLYFHLPSTCENTCTMPTRAITHYIYVAVLGRNQTVFCCVFRSHYHVGSALAQNLHEGQGSYALCKRGKYPWVYPAHMNPALNGSSVLECFEHGNVMEICNGIMFDFYPGLPHIYCMNSLFGILECNVCVVALIQLKSQRGLYSLFRRAAILK